MPTQSMDQLVEETRRQNPLTLWGRRSKTEKILLMVSGVALLGCAALAGVLASSSSEPARVVHQEYMKEDQVVKEAPKPSKKKSTRLPVIEGDEYDICDTIECVIAAAAIAESIDTSADPCDDFYQYACGGWMAKHPVPEASSRWGQFNLLEEGLANALSNILTSPISREDPKPINQAKEMYKACMDVKQLESLGVTPLTDFLYNYGGWPMTLDAWKEENFDWQTAIADARRSQGTSYLISVWVSADQKDTYKTAIYIDQTSLGMPRSVLTSPDKYEERVDAYIMYMENTASIIASELGSSVTSDSVRQEVEATLQFEMALANITTPEEERRDATRLYNNMTVSQLEELTGSLINWSELLSSMFSTAGIVINPSQRVIVQEVEYLKKLGNLIAETSSRTISNYLMWRHVKDLGDETNKAMRSESFKFQMVTRGVTAQKPRPEVCADMVNEYMGMAVGTKYVDEYFSQQAKDDANEMVEDIRGAFVDLLGVNKWMDKETKPKAVEKAEAMSKFIAYPNWYGNNSALETYYSGLKDLSATTHFSNIEALRLWMSTEELGDFGQPTKRDRWFSPPTIVNAYYLPEFNSITFPAGILQPPFYRANSLQALNYGGIGQVIGHEVTHGFDDQGSQNDKDGNTIPWWTEDTLDAFKDKAECIVDQYDTIRVPEVDELLPNATLNGVNTQGENIADNGGLREALLAYLKYVERTGEEPRLPGIHEFTPLQLFFLANANIWCNTITEEGLLNQILSDPHSPAKYRVLIPMSNMELFSKVWKCRPKAPMNPLDKCVVW